MSKSKPYSALAVNHVLLEHQPAWRQFLDETTRFIRANGLAESAEVEFLELTAREREVLDLIAAGSPAQHWPCPLHETRTRTTFARPRTTTDTGSDT